ncbi:MAG: adenylate/guanylate cyclase domain-containing protein [Elusimicrobia bacterium]|nr:adenylate/guanylate cyclase domain-containing protein [Elusimicrobiota bacterium]
MNQRTQGLGRLLPLAALLAAVGGLALVSRQAEIGRAVELKTLDWRFRRLSAPERRDPRIALVMVDQASLDHFERESVYWPWPRGIYEAVLRFLKAGGAKAVVFDVLFTNPSPSGAAEDAVLGRALKDFGPVVMAMETGRDAHPLRPNAPPERFSVKAGAALAASALARKSVRLPVPDVLAGSRLLGDVKVDADLDGVFRRVPLLAAMDGRLYPTLPLAAAILATGKTPDELNPKLTDGRMLVRYHGKALTENKTIKTYDAYQIGDLLLSWQAIEDKRTPKLPPSLFKDKIVFVGMSAAGLLDNRPSPISPVFPGTEIIAAATDNLMNGDFLTRAPSFAVIGLVFLALILAGAASRISPHAWAALGVMLAASAALAGIACYVFTRGVWLDVVAPQLSLWLGFAAASAYGYAVEGRQKRYIQAAFSQYLSPQIVERIAVNPEMLALGGERRDVTFYFSDIQGFTTFSEQLSPERLTKLMNRYLGEMTDTILASGGTLDKYIGDAVMAFWGAPVPCENHALIACKAALANQKRLEALREEFSALGYPPVFNRIGLNSGPASIGNMGSAARLSYTAIGDNVNLASRLEGANKAYGTYILISESTRRGAGDAVEVRELDFVKVKGKNLPIRVYELLGLKGETADELVQKARLFESGLSFFRGRKFDEAVSVFESVISSFGADYASGVYLDRCRAYVKEAPPPDWDGSHALTEK